MAVPAQLLAIGVIRSEVGVLLVRQTTVAAETGTAWVLPGGRVSPRWVWTPRATATSAETTPAKTKRGTHEEQSDRAKDGKFVRHG